MPDGHRARDQAKKVETAGAAGPWPRVRHPPFLPRDRSAARATLA
jgi:hypothetical protein